MKIPKIFVPEKNFEKNIENLLNEEPVVAPKYDTFEIIKANSYAEGIAELKRWKQKPFTFSDNVEARIVDYEVNGEDGLFDTWLDSVTGIAYKAKSTKFKLILRSDRLENIKPDFNQSFIPINYGLEQGIEFDSKKGKYNQPLKRGEVKNHKFWLAAMNNDKEKLEKYVDLWFDKTGKDKGMGVYLRSNTSYDKLWALVFGTDYDSDADGSFYLLGGARFVSGAQ